MGFIRDAKYYDELRHAREDESLVAVATILLDKNLTKDAIYKTEVFKGGGVLPPDASREDKKNFDWLKFIFTSLNPETHFGGNKQRIPNYLLDVLREVKDKFGFSDEVLLSPNVSDKMLQAILLYAACYDVEANYSDQHLKEKKIIMAFNDIYMQQNNADAQAQIKVALGLIEKSHDVLKSGHWIKDKHHVLDILLAKIVKEYRGELSGPQIPKDLQLQIITTINDLANEIKSWKKASIYQRFFGGLVQTKIELKQDKINFLQDLLAANDLKKAHSIIMTAINSNTGILDGRTVEVADAVLKCNAEDPKQNAILTPEKPGEPTKQVMPDEPDSNDVSPRTPRN